jgi:hypothetical protein
MQTNNELNQFETLIKHLNNLKSIKIKFCFLCFYSYFVINIKQKKKKFFL